MPQVKDAPEGLNKILESAYRSCMQKYKNEEKCSKIAWGAAKNAGWKKGNDGKWHKEDQQEYTFDSTDGACEWLGVENETTSLEQGTVDDIYSAIAVIGDKFYKGKYLPYKEIEKAHMSMNGAYHDINHFGTTYIQGFYARPNIEWIVGYQDNTVVNSHTKAMKTNIYIEDDMPKAPLWRAFVKLCEKAGRTPNVSVSFWASRKDVLANELPKEADWMSEGYKESDYVPYLYDLSFRALATVFRGACDDKKGCGIGMSSEKPIPIKEDDYIDLELNEKIKNLEMEIIKERIKKERRL